MSTQEKVMKLWKEQGQITPDDRQFMKAYYAKTRASGNVLDLGCNNGYIAGLVDQKAVTEYVGIDVNGHLMKELPFGKLIEHDITVMPWPVPSDYFNLVLWLEGPECVVDPKVVFKEAMRVLATGGQMIIATPKFVRHVSPVFPNVYEYGLQELIEELTSVGFRIVNYQEVSISWKELHRKLFLVDAAAPEKFGVSYWDNRAQQAQAACSPGTTKEEEEKSAAEHVKLLTKLIPDLKSKSVLDVGCGDGRLTKQLVPVCRSIQGFDHSPKMVELAAGRVPDVSFDIARLGDRLPYKDNEFDVTIAWYVMLHVVDDVDWKRGVQELQRITKETIVIAEPVLETWTGGVLAPHNVLRTTQETIMEMMSWKLTEVVTIKAAQTVSVMRFDRTMEDMVDIPGCVQKIISRK